jgi:hypothetical protein
MMLENPAINTDMYDAVNAKMDVEANPPAGLICHTAALDNGVFRIVDVWESKDAYDRFSKERLGPAIQDVMGQAPPSDAPTEKFYELHKVISP